MMKQESRQRYKNENETSFRKHYFTPLHFIRGIRKAKCKVDEKLLREHAQGIQRYNGMCVHITQQYNHTTDHEDGGTIFKIRKPRKDENDKESCGITARRDKCPSGNESVGIKTIDKHKKHENGKCRQNIK